ncbi:hypothetical protein JGI14_11282 [Candidatus Kryptonium thompsonii]|uniref:Uncharacterized protein n=1 Tax=Candidatus Kryptonium thompsonii TaxID=1633631 RepID=A0A0P1M1W4_9BACT|nr:hypothetical protein [Candidatus Kryptonium thompsoni]CUS78780.1 hypothetical protein JGI15_100428 [Candidatus Kryptonium thompsoni]CUS81023.1 hypothetical protein JGI8_00464 [Candidatus Kryptonium thompsoni]CUS84981.1 hypothetical protein JGI12_00825 [Candidatus Kryptonium thompsoni]CUS86745.1 hypothetical protein JGI13_01359 [Candidatus Kryptonium thompsoni]CUS88526.1 hypothetical protein JGI6_01296 [Candidatus Kryptonium thompsoni]
MRIFRKKSLVVFVILALLVYDFYPSLAYAQKEKVKVGFIGFKFEGVGVKVQRDITNSVLYLLAGKPSVEIVSPEEAVSIVGSEKINSVLSLPSENDVVILSHMLGVDYLFFGNFVNQGKDTNDVVLYGTFECFDRPKRRFHTVEITWRYEDIDSEVKKIDKEFISKVLPKSGGVFTSLFFIIVLGLVIIGTYTLVWGLGGESQEAGAPPVAQ